MNINNYKKLSNQMHITAVDVIEKIVKDNDNRISNCKENIGLLAEGVFYCNDYAKLLYENDLTNRINSFKKNGSFFHGYVNSKCFDMTKDTTSLTGFQVHKFTIKKDVKPTDALLSVIKGLSLIECGAVVTLGDYSALLKVIGKKKFNAIFDATSKTPLIIGHGRVSYLGCIRVGGKIELSQEKIKAGDRFYIDGPYALTKVNVDSDVKKTNLCTLKHFNGEAKAYNVICKSGNEEGKEPLFLGLGLNPNGATYDEIVETLITEYNKTPVDDLSILTDKQYKKMINDRDEARSNLIKELSTNTISKEDFFNMEGGQVHKVTYHFQRIQQLIESNIKTACKLFAEWNNL